MKFKNNLPSLNTVSKSLIIFLVFVSLAGIASAQSSSEELYYTFDGSCPPSDQSGNGRDGTCSNGVSTGVNGLFGSSYDFSSTGANVKDGNFDITGSFALVANVQAYSASNGNEHGQVFNKRESYGSNNIGMRVYDGAGDGNDGDGLPDMSCFLQSSGEDSQIDDVDLDTEGYSYGDWGQFACMYDASSDTLKAYFNGTEIASTSHSDGVPSNTNDWTLGARTDDPSSEYFAGLIDEPRIYSSTLTTTELDNLRTSNSLTSEEVNINSIECEVGGSWQSCNNAGFGDTITQVRANVTGDNTVSSVDFTLEDLYDSNTRFSSQGYTSSSGDYFIYDNTDVTIDDSGDWKLSVDASDGSGNSDSSSTTWSVSWGSLSASLDKPGSDITVEQDQNFNLTGTVTCSGGECASEGEQVELWADPVWTEEPVKLGSGVKENGFQSGDTVEVSSSSGYSKDDILYLKNRDDPSEMLENYEFEGGHKHSEETHTHGGGEHSHTHDEGFVLNDLFKPVVELFEGVV